MDYETNKRNKKIEFSETTFYRGLNATYGKIPVKLELCLNFIDGFNANYNDDDDDNDQYNDVYGDNSNYNYNDDYNHRINSSLNGNSRDGFSHNEKFIKLELFVGIDRMYRINDIGNFLESMEGLQSYYFSKNFILEPTKMYFEKTDSKILEFLNSLKVRRIYNNEHRNKYINGYSNKHNKETGKNNIKLFDRVFDREKREMHGNQVLLDEDESERFLDLMWDDIESIKFNKQSDEIIFKNDVNIKIFIEKEEKDNIEDRIRGHIKGGTYPLVMIIDYSEYGDFRPIAFNFRYVVFKDKENQGKKLIVKLPENKKELFMNLFKFKNEENIVCFKIGEKDKTVFRRNFLDKYCSEIKISMDSTVEKEILADRLTSRVYFDVAPKGIVSKVEFSYGDKVINPLDDIEVDKSFREFDSECYVLSEMKFYGFKEYGRLFLLDDVEKIMFLLTDDLKTIKKVSEVYYSEDFKKLHVRNLSDIDWGLKLSEDGSVIHMNINLENISDEELAELLDAIDKKKKYYRLRNGSIINLGNVESDKLVDLINSLDINKENIMNGAFEIPLSRCLYIDNYLREKGVENVKMGTRLGCLIKDLSNPQDADIEKEIDVELDEVLGEKLKGTLRNYQITGVRWLKSMARYSLGGILADDMGLGKTLQVLAFIASEKNRKLPCLVVAPTSIVYNWKVEAEKFTPRLKVLVVTGTKDKRSLLINGCNEYDLVITSYGALKNDIEEYKKIKFSYIFVDEAQNIKNPMTLNANSVKSLTAKCCFALTGTPIENRLTEIWSIFDFVMPGYLLNKRKFANTFEEPIIRDKNQDKMDELSRMIKPFIIRRLKKDVLSELPEKIKTNYFSEMTYEQKKLYAAYYKEVKNELIAKIDEYGIERNHIEILTALTRLRQICAHPGTFLDNYSGGSGKLELAMEVIDQSLNSGHSILLFSQFTKMLKIIRNELENNSINYYYLDGTMKPEERTMEIDNFNSDKEAVFLISLKAGGTGLNLTKADIIIHFDPWWNPAVEDQASDRAHRIGQKNVVQVYKLLTEGTIEEKISELQERKRNLIESIIKPGENFLNSLSEDEIRELFR